MSTEILAGLFGCLATLVGVLATHAVSFSRDARLQKDASKTALSVLINDLRTALESLEKSALLSPNLGGLEGFLLQGHMRSLPAGLTARVLNARFQLQLIHELTRLKNEFQFARVAANQSYRGGVADEIGRSRESHGVALMKDLPKLISDLETEMEKA